MKRIAFTLCLLCAASFNTLHAQPSLIDPVPPASNQANGAPKVTLPLIDPATEIKGRALVEALRKGGFNLYMRHALQIPPHTAVCDGPSLQQQGIEQTNTVATAIRQLKIPVSRVLTSEPCRNQETARRLGLGTPEVSAGLNPLGTIPGFDYAGARSNLFAELPVAGTNVIMVSHLHGSANKAEWMHLELAEVIVYQPDGKGSSKPVARIRVEQWAELIKVVGESGPR
ncbi:MAG: hypothetical protein ABI905_00040 [Betaproteobacteria bacterium]